MGCITEAVTVSYINLIYFSLEFSEDIFHFQCTIDNLSGAAAKARTQHSEGAGGQEMLPWQDGSWPV